MSLTVVREEHGRFDDRDPRALCVIDTADPGPRLEIRTADWCRIDVLGFNDPLGRVAIPDRSAKRRRAEPSAAMLDKLTLDAPTLLVSHIT